MIGGVIAVTDFNAYEAAVIAGSSVSDLTRLAYTEASFNMMTDHPLFGLGLGQFAFWLLENVPSWAYLSYEVVNWSSSYPPVHFWPASYTVYGRLAGELGIVGLLSWILLWLGLAMKMLIASLDYQRLTGSLPAVSYALVVSCFCVLLSGLTTDTFRSPMIWITLGLSCRYLVEIRTGMRRGSDVRPRMLNLPWTRKQPEQVYAIPHNNG
jgi:O-antigen ligase